MYLLGGVVGVGTQHAALLGWLARRRHGRLVLVLRALRLTAAILRRRLRVHDMHSLCKKLTSVTMVRANIRFSRTISECSELIYDEHIAYVLLAEDVRI